MFIVRFRSVVVFCLVFPSKSSAQFFSNVHGSFVFDGRSAVQIFSNINVCFVFCHVQFLFLVMFMCFVLRHRISVQFVLYLSILVMFMSVLCFVMFSFSYSVMFMFLVLHHRIAVQFFLYLPILVMLFKCSLCILICECIWLFFAFIGCMFIL